MEEILAKFIDEGKRENKEMEIFIKEFRTTNELLLKERSNLLSELKIEVNELSNIMGNVLILKKVKRVTTRREKMTSEANPEDSRIPIILGRPFLAIARAMIDVFNKKMTLMIGDDEVIFDMDQSIKKPPTEDDECHGIAELYDTISIETQELLDND
nr:hypothetical protein [Tanacetum cinerariifolium]